MVMSVICMTSFSSLSRHHAEDLVITRRQQKSWSLKCWCCADQRFQVLICVGDGMAEETNVCGISGDPSQMLNDDRGPRSDRFAQLYAAVESMYSATQEIA